MLLALDPGREKLQSLVADGGGMNFGAELSLWCSKAFRVHVAMAWCMETMQASRGHIWCCVLSVVEPGVMCILRQSTVGQRKARMCIRYRIVV